MDVAARDQPVDAADCSVDQVMDATQAAGVRAFLAELCSGLCTDPVPEMRQRDERLPHAPLRQTHLSVDEQRLSVTNALRYFPERLHAQLAEEFCYELRLYGHIYTYRWMPDTSRLRAWPMHLMPCRSAHAAAVMLMLLNNLDERVAQFPQELVTYGGNGQVLSNWAQFRVVMHLLATMNDRQTLVLYSGHPHGLFASSEAAPRVVITNGMVVGRCCTERDQQRLFALGVSQYGQMTAGGLCYIGPQGIVHGTMLTLLNAGRRYLGTTQLAGVVFVTAGLGGMSGAQAKAAVIAGCIGVVAEVSRHALEKRRRQGWLCEVETCIERLIERMRRACAERRPLSIGFHGNVVAVWRRLADHHRHTGELLVQLGSDQTSCHAVRSGGYCPVALSHEQAQQMVVADPQRFRALVCDSLMQQVEAIDYLAAQGMRFWDYGNAFLLEAHRAGARVTIDSAIGSDETNSVREDSLRFCYPSYVHDMMGDIFSLGFGPFRWVCTSRLAASDLATTDALATETLEAVLRRDDLPERVRQQYEDNLRWICAAAEHRLVVGSQARILYSDGEGRVALALAFNAAVADGRLAAPVVVCRDHHDVGGTDSPYRETANVGDGSAVCADMAVQNWLGGATRGATWVALHNGGGVGWGEAVNGGFGLVLDGSEAAGQRAAALLRWDVNNGVARRCWAGNTLARQAIETAMRHDKDLRVTLPSSVDSGVVDAAFRHPTTAQ